MSQVKINDPLVIAAHLEGGITGKFVRATIKDILGAEIAGSPVTLADLGDGLYIDTSLTKTRGEFVVLIEVFDDAGFALPNQDFENGAMSFIDPPYTVLFDVPIDVDIAINEPIDIDITPNDRIDIDITPPDSINLDIECD